MHEISSKLRISYGFLNPFTCFKLHRCIFRYIRIIQNIIPFFIVRVRKINLARQVLDTFIYGGSIYVFCPVNIAISVVGSTRRHFKESVDISITTVIQCA